jgi:excisionase family DNA binding protein
MINDIQSITDSIAEIKTAMLQSKSILTPKEAAFYLGISMSTLYKMTSAGILPFSKPNGKLIYFSKVRLDEWILCNMTKTSEERAVEAATYINSKH